MLINLTSNDKSKKGGYIEVALLFNISWITPNEVFIALGFCVAMRTNAYIEVFL